MSDTPRTDAISGWGVTYRGKSSSEELYIDPNGPFVHSTFARQLERELDEANERIKRLEEAGNDLVWWFCQREPSELSTVQSEALKQWRGLRGRRSP